MQLINSLNKTEISILWCESKVFKENPSIYSAVNICATLKLPLSLVIRLYLCYSYHTVYFYVVRFTSEGESFYRRVQYFYCWLLEALLMLQSKWAITQQKCWELLVIYIYALFENLSVEAKKKNCRRNRSWHSISGLFYKCSDWESVTGAGVHKCNCWLTAYPWRSLWYEVRMIVTSRYRFWPMLWRNTNGVIYSQKFYLRSLYGCPYTNAMSSFIYLCTVMYV